MPLAHAHAQLHTVVMLVKGIIAVATMGSVLVMEHVLLCSVLLNCMDIQRQPLEEDRCTQTGKQTHTTIAFVTGGGMVHNVI